MSACYHKPILYTILYNIPSVCSAAENFAEKIWYTIIGCALRRCVGPPCDVRSLSYTSRTPAFRFGLAACTTSLLSMIIAAASLMQALFISLVLCFEMLVLLVICHTGSLVNAASLSSSLYISLL